MTGSVRFRPRCPTCDMLADPTVCDKYLPFCSDRCRLIDLGRWLNEEHQLPTAVDDEEASETPSSDQRTPRLPPGWHDA